MIRWCLLAVFALLPAGVAAAGDRAPQGYDDLGRQLRLSGNALRAALDDALPDGVRVVGVEAGYLAGQGVLVIVDLASPWYRLDGRDTDLAPELSSLEQIPDMVHEILTEMNIGLSRGEVAELQALRGIRDEQRALRAEQRALRARLREFRRERLRAPPDRAEALSREIDGLESEFAAAEARERALAADAETRRVDIDGLPARAPAALDRQTLDAAVARVVCGYGAGLELHDDAERLNVVVRRADATRYYVFPLDRVRSCAGDAAEPASLLEDSLRYDG